MANISLSSSTTTSLTVYVSGLDSGYSYNDRVTKWYVDGTLKKTVDGDPSPGATSGSTVKLSSLSAGTIYTIKAEIYYYAGTSTLKKSIITGSFCTKPNITLSFPRVWSDAIEVSISKSGDFSNRYVQWSTSSSSFSSTNRLPSSGYSTASPYKPIIKKIGSSNLSANTKYYFRVSAATSSDGENLVRSAKTGNIRTAEASAGSFVSATDTTITCEVASFSYYSYQRKVYFQAYLNNTKISEGESGVIAAYATESGEVTITGLSPGTEYTIKCYVYLYGDQSTTLLNTFTGTTTGQASATTRFSVSAPSSGYQDEEYGTTLTVNITTVDSNYRYNQVWYRISGSGSAYGKTSFTTSTSITLSNLTPGENYEINVYSSSSSSSSASVYPSPDNSETVYTNGQATLAYARETSISANVKIQNSSYSRKVMIDAYESGEKYQSCSHPVTISNTDTANDVKVDGLKPNTTYNIYCYVEYPVNSGTYKRVGGFSATTAALQGSLSVASNTETGVDWSVTGLSTNSGYQRIIYFDLATSSGGSNVYGNSKTISATTSSASNTCWNIPPSTGSSATTLYYSCYVRFNNQVNTDGKSVQFLLGSGTYTVPYVQGSVSGTAVAETSITCQLTGLSSYPVERTISIDAIPASGSTVNYSGTVSASTTSKTGIQITGLKKGTDYTVYAYIKFGTTYGPTGDSYYSLGSYIVKTAGTNISVWTWTAPNTYSSITRTGFIATQAQMTSAKNALDKVDGYTTQDFSHRVWNDLVWKVSEARVAKGVSSQWNDNYGCTRSETLMDEDDSTDRVLTAVRYNSLKNNLGENYSTGIADVSTNDSIIAQTHFYQLTDKLNEWIG